MMNTSSFDQDSFLLSDYEMDDMEYSPSPSASPLIMHPDITNNIMTSPSIPKRTNNCCGHDPYFNIMEICQFCNNEICSSCRIKSVSTPNNTSMSLPSQQQNHNNKTPKINKSHDIDQYDTYSYSQSLTIEKYQCKACTIKQEEESMANIISIALNESKLIIDTDDNHEVHIISIIAQYSVGHIIPCCDTTRNCMNDISISNRFDFESEFIDSDNNKIINTEYYELNPSNPSESNITECEHEHASIHTHTHSEMNMTMTAPNPFKMSMDHSMANIHIQHLPNISPSNYHRHGMNNKVKLESIAMVKKQNKHKQHNEDVSIPIIKAMEPESKQMNSNYVDIYGQRRTVFCNDCHNAKRSATTPFMMLMATKRFQKNQFGIYE